MKTLFTGILFILILSKSLLAQAPMLVNAAVHFNDQVGGSSKAYYQIILKSDDSLTPDSIYFNSKKIILVSIPNDTTETDTVITNTKGYALMRHPSGDAGRWSADTINHIYDINIEIQSHNRPEMAIATYTFGVRHFKSDALLVFHSNKKKLFLTISEFKR